MASGYNDFFNRLWNILFQKSSALKCRASKKTKIVFTEGYLDASFLLKCLKEDVDVCSAGNKEFFYQKGIHNPKGSVKDAVCRIVDDIEGKPSNLDVYGVVDRDLDGTAVETDRLFLTDKTDIETTLLSCEAFSLGMFEGCENEIENSILCQAYQLGCVRKGFIDYCKKKPIITYSGQSRTLNVRSILNDEDLFNSENKLFKPGKDLSLNALFSILLKSKDNYLNNEINNSVARGVINNFLRDNNYADNKGVFTKRVENFDKNEMGDCWMAVRGHDVFGIAKSFVPSIKDLAAKQLNDFIVDHANREKFKSTQLYKKMSTAGLVS